MHAHTIYIICDRCALYTIYNHILALQVINANEKRQVSYLAASENLEEKTKEVNSLQKQLENLENQKRSLQEKLENVCVSIAFTLFVIRFWKRTKMSHLTSFI